nr:antibiotic biosynthesis monooxygenase [Haloactinopolyspora alba]
MIIEYIPYRISDHDAAEFVAAYRRAAESLAAAPECVDYELTRCMEDPEHFVLRITWTSVEAHLEGFRRGPSFRAFFAEIQPYVGAIEEMRHYEPVGVHGSGAATPSLYSWAGGAAALDELCAVFYRAVFADPELAPLFRDMDPGHPHHVARWLGEVFGGPAVYSEARGGHAHMITRHLGRGITEPQRRRWMQLLIDAADEVGLPSDPEFRAAFVGYLEWGTRMAVQLSAPGVEPDLTEPMPTWGWAVAPR